MNDLERHLLEELADDPQGVLYSNSAKETVVFDHLADRGFVKRERQDGYQITNAGLQALGLKRCPNCGGYGFDVDVEIFDEKGELQAEKCLVCEGRGSIATEHGDDAPEPTPQPKPVTTFEEEWPKWEGGYVGSFCRLCKGDNCTATRQRLEITDGKVYIHVQTQCFDCGQELQGSRTEYALEELVKDHIHLSRYLATVNADLKTTRRMHKGAESNVDYWQRQFKQVEAERDAARAAQNQLRDALVAVTAERDALKLQLEMLNTLPIAAQETGRYQEALETILRRAQGGLEYRNVVTLLHRLNEIIRYAEVALNPAE